MEPSLAWTINSVCWVLAIVLAIVTASLLVSVITMNFLARLLFTTQPLPKGITYCTVLIGADAFFFDLEIVFVVLLLIFQNYEISLSIVLAAVIKAAALFFISLWRTYRISGFQFLTNTHWE